MRVAYVNYGAQSGVTASLTRALQAGGAEVEEVNALGPLELRWAKTRLPRPTPSVLWGVALSVLQYGERWRFRMINTPFSFDVHSAAVGRELLALARRPLSPPDVILQNGALFAPGQKPVAPYVLLLDNTCAITEKWPAAPEVGLLPERTFGPDWFRRETALYLGARAIATFSAVVRDSLLRDYGVDPARVHVVGAGCNIFPERVERHHDGQTFLFVGKESWPRKGGPVLLRAFARLRRERPSARLILVGPSEQFELPEGAVNLGLQSFAKVQELFSQATAFVLPTLREPFGIAFLDALACGVPCIGTNVGAVPEMLDNGALGRLVPPGDEAALCAAMRELLDDPARAEAMGAAGRLKIAERCRWEHVAQRLLPLLRGEPGGQRAA